MKFFNKNKILSAILVGSHIFGMNVSGGFVRATNNNKYDSDNFNLNENDAKVINDKSSDKNETQTIDFNVKNIFKIIGYSAFAAAFTKVAYDSRKGAKICDKVSSLNEKVSLLDKKACVSIDKVFVSNDKKDATDESNKHSEFQAISPNKIDVSLENIGGYDNVKKEFLKAIDRLKNPESYNKAGITSTMQGIVLYGPPGTGKTMFAKAVAKKANVPFFNVSGSEFVKIYVGNGAYRVRQLFDEVKKIGKCVVFIDEIDAVGGARNGGSNNSEHNQTLNQLLTCLTDINSLSKGSVLVIAATNRLDMLDGALIRSGRFNKKIEIGLPDADAINSIIEKHKSRYPVLGDVDLSNIVEDSNVFSGADISTSFETCVTEFVYNKNKNANENANENVDKKKENEELRDLIKTELENIKKSKTKSENFQINSFGQKRNWRKFPLRSVKKLRKKCC